MVAEIISVGTELLLGQIVNTDAQYLSQKLGMLGINVYYQVTVGDNAARLEGALKTAMARSDIVIATGGLGPTQDDLTKETIAEYCGLPLELHHESLEAMERFFKGRVMPGNNKKQAYMPKGAHVLPNRKGTAPGCVITHEGRQIIILPGPPHELTDMFEQAVMPLLIRQSGEEIVSRVMRIFGMGESEVESRVRDLMQGANPTVAPYAGYGEVTLRLTVRLKRGEDAAPYLDPLEKEIKNRLGDVVYAVEDKPLHEVVGDLLLKKGYTLATAESCTGGMIAARLVEVPGISAAFLEGHVTYSNESKVRALGVSRDTLEKYGAVSEETALEMAACVREKSGADIGLSVTGIAGPGGGSEEKPVGLVYIAISGVINGGAVRNEAYKLNLTGDRARIRSMAAQNALDKLRRYIREE